LVIPRAARIRRTTQIQRPDSAIVSSSYSGITSGSQTTQTDEASKTKTTVSDAFGRIKQVTEDPGGLNYITSYGYDVLDDLTSVMQGVQTRSFQYDSLKRLTQAQNPETGGAATPITYTYDANGNLTSRSDGRPVTIQIAYDAINRVSRKTYPDGTEVLYTYDSAGSYSIGRLTQISNPNSITAYTAYDALGRITAISQDTGGIAPGPFNYAYNKASGVTSITYPSGRVVSTAYDALNRPQQTTSGVTQYALGAQYAPHAALRQVTLNNSAMVETTSYDPYRLQPYSINLMQGASALLTVGYSYCGSVLPGVSGSCTKNNGNLLKQKITVGTFPAMTQYYSYDAANRLSAATEDPTTVPSGDPPAVQCPDGGSSWCQQYSYDNYGNRTITNRSKLTASLLEPMAFVTATNRMANGSTSWTYDNAGNLTGYINGAISGSYAYDAENRMTAFCPNVTNPAQCTAAWVQGNTVYTYDGNGRRVSKKAADGTLTTYVYDAGGNLTAEYGGAPTQTGTQYLTADHLGSTRRVTGNTVECRDYLPFAEEIPSTQGTRGSWGISCYGAEVGVTAKFTGKERDVETGLDYFGARYFSAAQGRFTSPDAKRMTSRHLVYPQKWNKYAYVQNNPLSSVDPNGLDDYKIFRTIDPQSFLGNWTAATASAKANGHTITFFGPKEATIENYNKALGDPNSRVVFVGHTLHDPQTGQVNQIQLGNGNSMGSQFDTQQLNSELGSFSLSYVRGETNVAANSVALFGCNSIQLADQYNQAGLFVGMDSGPDAVSSINFMAAAAAAWVSADAQARPDPFGTSTFIGPMDPITSAQAAFDRRNPNDYDKGDKVVQAKKDPPRQ
jgi:RHS repeat-associated protein